MWSCDSLFDNNTNNLDEQYGWIYKIILYPNIDIIIRFRLLQYSWCVSWWENGYHIFPFLFNKCCSLFLFRTIRACICIYSYIFVLLIFFATFFLFRKRELWANCLFISNFCLFLIFCFKTNNNIPAHWYINQRFVCIEKSKSKHGSFILI